MTLTQNDVMAWLRQQSDRTFLETVYAAARGRGPDAMDDVAAGSTYTT